MKEIFFNELSTKPLCNNDEEIKDRLKEYSQILKFLGNTVGIEKVRSKQEMKSLELKKNSTLEDYIRSHWVEYQNSSISLILAMTIPPFIDDDTEEEKQFVYTDAKLNKGNDLIEAEGLTCAYLAKSFAIGFASEPFWKESHSFELSIHNQQTHVSKGTNVFCISAKEQLEKDDFINFVIELFSLKFKSSDLKEEDKPIKLRDDHGKNLLNDFAKKLRKEIYVKEIINSLKFSPHSKEFISKVHKDGKIELRLKKTDKGHGLIIQTTAENLLETKYIAATLKKKYD